MPREAGEDREDEYLTAGQAARLLGFSPKTINRWADEGRIVYTVTAEGHRRFVRSVIEEIDVSTEDDEESAG